MAGCAEPLDHAHEVLFRHGGAARGRAIQPAPDVKKDRTPFARDGAVGVVTDLDQPAIGKVMMSHFLLLKPWRRMRRILNRDKLVVIRTVDVIDPGVSRSHLMKWIIGPGWQTRIVSVNLSDAKNPGRSAAVMFFLVQT